MSAINALNQLSAKIFSQKMCSIDTEIQQNKGEIVKYYNAVRTLSINISSALTVEDQAIQSMPDASPTKWHLAHTTWFFETFILKKYLPDYRVFNDNYGYLFNSYYNSIGPQFRRDQRGMLSRPSLSEVIKYRKHVDQAIEYFLTSDDGAKYQRVVQLIWLGLAHEEQHQELMLTDIKHLLSQNPLMPVAYARRAAPHAPDSAKTNLDWYDVDEGVYEIGMDHKEPPLLFSFDNEGPKHKVYLGAYSIATRLVTNGEYIAFIQDGGYESASNWLADGWSLVESARWRSPLYWWKSKSGWMRYTIHGPEPVYLDEPIAHLSYYEADAYARWAGARLPTESEWEVAAGAAKSIFNLKRQASLDLDCLEPQCCQPEQDAGAPHFGGMFGAVWQWTASPYTAYPGYSPPTGAIGEYNGKFMCNQMVLRGGSCLTPAGHIRPTYRNFFPPHARWQMTGLRLARSI